MSLEKTSPKARSLASLTARDVMSETVLALSDDLALEDAAAHLSEHEISGAPVLDAAGSLLGVISQTDVVRTLSGLNDDDGERRAAARLTVRQVMTPIADTVAEDATVPEMAKIMVAHHYHRLVVARGERPVGIVSSMDLLEVLAGVE